MVKNAHQYKYQLSDDLIIANLRIDFAEFDALANDHDEVLWHTCGYWHVNKLLSEHIR